MMKEDALVLGKADAQTALLMLASRRRGEAGSLASQWPASDRKQDLLLQENVCLGRALRVTQDSVSGPPNPPNLQVSL